MSAQHQYKVTPVVRFSLDVLHTLHRRRKHFKFRGGTVVALRRRATPWPLSGRGGGVREARSVASQRTLDILSYLQPRKRRQQVTGGKKYTPCIKVTKLECEVS